MPNKIQRVPRGLAELLSTFGGQTPIELEDRVRAQIDSLQFYGLSQRTFASANSGGPAASSLTTPQAVVIPSSTSWSVLFAAKAGIQPVQAATTEVGFAILLARSGSPPTQGFAFLNNVDMVPVVGSNLFVTYPGPLLMLPPGAQVGVLLYSTLGAAAQPVTIDCEFGLLG